MLPSQHDKQIFSYLYGSIKALSFSTGSAATVANFMAVSAAVVAVYFENPCKC